MFLSAPRPVAVSRPRRSNRRRWLGRSAALLTLALALLGTLVGPGCTTYALAPTLCPQQRNVEARPPWKVAIVLPDDSGQAQLAQTEALATGVLCDLLPGDTVIVVKESTFEVVLSAVVPGDAELLASAGQCEEVPAGGPSHHCLLVAEAQATLAAWRMDAAAAISGVVSLEARPAACNTGSGWPRNAVVQLLLSLQQYPGTQGYSWLLVSGDADSRGDGPPLGDLAADVHIVVAPYVLSCGDPSNLRDWFAGARGIDLFPIERPASEFGAFLRSHATGATLSTGGTR